jgi:hypothetical protein
VWLIMQSGGKVALILLQCKAAHQWQTCKRKIRSLCWNMLKIVQELFDLRDNTTCSNFSNVVPVLKNTIQQMIDHSHQLASPVNIHILSSYMMKHIETHDILYDLQHGFRKRRLFKTQTISLIQELCEHPSSPPVCWYGPCCSSF